jgi:hypothetical protein
MVQLADWLPWKQSRVSEAERGLRGIPDGIVKRIVALEDARDDLVESMLEHLELVPDAALIVHAEDAGYLLAHQTDPHIPAAVQRVAAALAASTWERETGKRPLIVIED